MGVKRKSGLNDIFERLNEDYDGNRRYTKNLYGLIKEVIFKYLKRDREYVSGFYPQEGKKYTVKLTV